jgi:hypothetical protein
MSKQEQTFEHENYESLVRLGLLTRRELTPEERAQVEKQKAERAYREAIGEAMRLASIEHERVYGPPGLPGYESSRQYTATRNAALLAARRAVPVPDGLESYAESWRAETLGTRAPAARNSESRVPAQKHEVKPVPAVDTEPNLDPISLSLNLKAIPDPTRDRLQSIASVAMTEHHTATPFASSPTVDTAEATRSTYDPDLWK